MTKRVLWGVCFTLGLGACGDSGDSENALRGANQLTAERVAAIGDYCCYENGRATEDSPEACGSGEKACIWSETSNDVDRSGRGTMCGYLACQ
jgi:hypothetical protein